VKESGVRIGKFGVRNFAVGVGIGYFISDSETLGAWVGLAR